MATITPKIKVGDNVKSLLTGSTGQVNFINRAFVFVKWDDDINLVGYEKAPSTAIKPNELERV